MQITLLVPALFGFSVVEPNSAGLFKLLRYLHFQHKQHALSPSQSLYDVLIHVEDMTEVARGYAAMSVEHDLGHVAEDDFWVRADPVHLTSGFDGLRLSTDGNCLQFSQDHLRNVAKIIRIALSEHGMELYTGANSNWYVRIPKKHALLQQWQHVGFTPLDRVLGRSIQKFTPQGKSAMRWQSLLNHLQIMLHQQGGYDMPGETQLPINSVWFWGAGFYPTFQNKHADFDQIIGGGTVGHVLTHAASIPHVALPPSFEDVRPMLQNSKRTLLVLDALYELFVYQNYTGWRESRIALESNWFAPLSQWLHRNGLPCSLSLLTGSALYKGIVHRAYRRYFNLGWWRSRYRSDANILKRYTMHENVENAIHVNGSKR